MMKNIVSSLKIFRISNIICMTEMHYGNRFANRCGRNGGRFHRYFRQKGRRTENVIRRKHVLPDFFTRDKKPAALPLILLTGAAAGIIAFFAARGAERYAVGICITLACYEFGAAAARQKTLSCFPLRFCWLSPWGCVSPIFRCLRTKENGSLICWVFCCRS